MKAENWKFLQKKSDEILIDGIFELKKQSPTYFDEIQSNNSGNYLISNKKIDYYIGEGKELKKRLRQQFNPKISTFYKTYLKAQIVKPLNINDFKVQTIDTKIGRKEIEEFGIVNLKTRLNKFQLKKRSQFQIRKNGLWNEVQSNFEEFLLLACRLPNFSTHQKY